MWAHKLHLAPLQLHTTAKLAKTDNMNILSDLTSVYFNQSEDDVSHYLPVTSKTLGLM